MIEIKLSQAAKRRHAAILLIRKNTVQIAKIRDVLLSIRILSFPRFFAFENIKGLIAFTA